MTDELENALRFGLTRAQPGSAAYLLAREVQQLRPIAEAAAVWATGDASVAAERALMDAVDSYRTGATS